MNDNIQYEPAPWSEQRQVPRIREPKDITQVRAAVDAVSGWLFPEEVDFLYNTARERAPFGAIVELGSFRGKSTVALASGIIASGAGATVTAVDTFEGSANLEGLGLDTFGEFRANVESAGVADVVRPLRALTGDAARSFDAPISMLFVDADHSYEGVSADFRNWFPKLMPNAVIAFHDSTWEGVERLLHEAVYGHLHDVRRHETICAARCAPARLGDQLRAWRDDPLRGKNTIRPLLRRIPAPIKRLVKH